MTVKEYTLSDAEAKLDTIASISLFLSTGNCPREIAFNLQDHMQDEIENLQGILGFMRIYPQIKAQELEHASDS
ncbi:hypothetical protein [Vibrio tapetis]|uniref:RstC protein n=2 Tax=Vibrio tapetis TaxID=52443 RepID=A0A2N8Z9N6_9VIBR|nr:hypothetical protein [Vibrio tapetis]ACB99599.1 RstC protein [Vibrio tapetis]SON48610.1 RstC protein [Vibrio tapetis subsp. tapetis]SON53450.1 RstC protein [Vibrio tapetis subsp. tapetis]